MPLEIQRYWNMYLVICIQVVRTTNNYFLSIRSQLSKEQLQVAHQDVVLDTQEFQLAHGKSSFLKPDKVAKLCRENSGTGPRICPGEECVTKHLLTNFQMQLNLWQLLPDPAFHFDLLTCFPQTQ